tara:strand:- start:64 stop:801 length:738 start_codon:yes stop_codon:yes gene_type:complete
MSFINRIILILIFFSILSCKKETKKHQSIDDKQIIINEVKKKDLEVVEKHITLLDSKNNNHTVLFNNFFLDTVFTKKHLTSNTLKIKITDTLGNATLGIFRGKWMKTIDNLGNSFFIPNFFLMNSLDVDTLNIDYVVSHNLQKIDYRENTNEYFTNNEEIIFKNFNSIESIYFLIKSMYEQTNNKFPTRIAGKKKTNLGLSIDYKINKEELSFLELNWFFDGGELLISFRKIGLNIIVNINEDFG